MLVRYETLLTVLHRVSEGLSSDMKISLLHLSSNSITQERTGKQIIYTSFRVQSFKD